MPQSSREGVGRAVLCPPKRRPRWAAACRGLPALPAMTDPLPKSLPASGAWRHHHQRVAPDRTADL
jgi:hypothetical protein